MGKPQIPQAEIAKMKKMRMTGHSLPEIRKSFNRGNGTVYKYIKDVVVLKEYAEILKQKQGGSKNRARILWESSALEAKKRLGRIGKINKLLILASLYWGEGSKNDLSLTNSDPDLIRVFIACLREIGVKKDELRLSLRLYENIDIKSARKHWAKVCGVGESSISSVNILEGKKDGKLPFGMCRVRITKGGKSFKLIMSMIGFIKSEVS